MITCNFSFDLAGRYYFNCDPGMLGPCEYNMQIWEGGRCKYWGPYNGGSCCCPEAKYAAFNMAINRMREIYIEIQGQDPAFHEALKAKREKQYVDFVCSIKEIVGGEWKPKI